MDMEIAEQDLGFAGRTGSSLAGSLLGTTRSNNLSRDLRTDDFAGASRTSVPTLNNTDRVNNGDQYDRAEGGGTAYGDAHPGSPAHGRAPEPKNRRRARPSI